METTKKLQLKTYGCGGQLDLSKFNSIKNDWIKPIGGLWASPINCQYGWKEWCEGENFGDLTSCFTFEIEGTVLTIDSFDDLYSMIWFSSDSGEYYPDFEAMKFIGIDAIHLTEKGQEKTRLTRPINLYGWDCECVLVLNPSCIKVI